MFLFKINKDELYMCNHIYKYELFIYYKIQIFNLLHKYLFILI